MNLSVGRRIARSAPAPGIGRGRRIAARLGVAGGMVV